MKNHKSPGLDGFPMEFYKAFADVLLDPLTQMFNQILVTCHLPPSWSQIIMTVMPKGKKNPAPCILSHFIVECGL